MPAFPHFCFHCSHQHSFRDQQRVQSVWSPWGAAWETPPWAVHHKTRPLISQPEDSNSLLFDSLLLVFYNQRELLTVFFSFPILTQTSCLMPLIFHEDSYFRNEQMHRRSKRTTREQTGGNPALHSFKGHEVSPGINMNMLEKEVKC